MAASVQPFDDRDGFIWYDGALKPWRDAKLHVLTHGLHYASAVFEGERAYNGTIFKLHEHSERLVNSCKVLGMPLTWTAEQIDAACIETLKANGLTDAYVRPIAWRGSEMMGIAAQSTKVHLAVAVWAWPSYWTAEARMTGIRLNISEWCRPHPKTAPTKAKAAGLYMIGTISKHQAEQDGYDDSLMLDYAGRVAEATGANIFFVMNGEIHTPTPECVLNGITRQTVMDLARKRGLKVVEREIQPDEMAKASECFLTGTAAEVMPVREIGSYKFVPGSVCRALMDDYTALVMG